MNIIIDVFKELFGMFLSDAWLTTATLALVALIAVIVRAEPLVGGGLLIVGCVATLVEATLREARRRRVG